VVELADFVSESGNPHNERRMRTVEVFVHSDLLDRFDVELVDTPGTGSATLHGCLKDRRQRSGFGRWRRDLDGSPVPGVDELLRPDRIRPQLHAPVCHRMHTRLLVDLALEPAARAVGDAASIRLVRKVEPGEPAGSDHRGPESPSSGRGRVCGIR